MFFVESNAKSVASALRKVVRDIHQFAHKDANNIGQITQSGIASHFDKLGHGGVDPSAIGGGVTWETHRSDLTEDERGNKFPLLDNTGHMRGAFTSGAATGGATDGRGSVFTHSSADSFATHKGMINQFGARGYHATFPKTGASKTMDIPSRPFLYWDQHMVDNIFRRASRYFEESVKKHQPRGLGE